MPLISAAQQSTFSSTGLTTIEAQGSGINFVNRSNLSESVVVGQKASNHRITTSSAADSFVVSGHGHTVNAGGGNDSVVVENARHSRLNGDAGDDTFEVKGVNHGSYLSGGAGSDLVRFTAGADLYHVRDRGTHFEFVKAAQPSDGASQPGSVVRVSKDVERVEFGDGLSFSQAQLTAIAAGGGQLSATGLEPSSALTLTGANGSLLRGTQFDDRFTIGSASTVQGGEGNDTVTDTKGWWNEINTGAGHDVVNSAGDWQSRTNLGAGDDRLNLDTTGIGVGGGGHGFHDGGSGEDTLSLTGANFVVQARQGAGFKIERGNAAASEFVNFERLELGGRTYTAAELGNAVRQAGGRLVLGADRNQTGAAGSDTLTLANGQWASIAAGAGNDVVSLSGTGVRGDGGAGNDTFRISNSRPHSNLVSADGGEGDDTFHVDDRAHQAANNLHALDGGQGNDMATFARRASEYRLTEAAGNTLTLTHIASGARTRLTDIESLRFEGGTRYSLGELRALFSNASAETVRGEISVRLADKGPEVAPEVRQLDARTTAISHGAYTVLLNRNERDAGRQQVSQVAVAVAAKDPSLAAIYAGTVQQGQTILSGIAGSTVKSNSYEDDANRDLGRELNSLLRDAQDNDVIDDEATFRRVVGMLTRPGSARAGGHSHEMMNVMDDFALNNGSAKLAIDTEAIGSQTAIDSAKITFANGGYTVLDMFDAGGQGGRMDVRVAQPQDALGPVATFDVIDEKTVGDRSSTHVFGKDHGSVGKDVVFRGGGVDGNFGSVGQYWAPDSAMAQMGLGRVARRDRLSDD
jgi:hypothetical protein